MPYPRVRVPDLGYHDVWLDLMGLAEDFAGRWTLIGAHMVAIHAWGAGLEPPRRSDDIDLVINLRLPNTTAKVLTDRLVEIGYVPEAGSAIGVVHRFLRNGFPLDLFAPENLGDRSAWKIETGAGGRLIQVPGGTQALLRSESQEIESRGTRGVVPLPSLLAATLLKARSYRLRQDRFSHEADLGDLAFLLGLSAEQVAPEQWLEELKGSERAWLRSVAEPLFANETAWSATQRPDRAQRLFRMLLA
jgi:predicted nucleotidyltransferase